MQPESTLQGRLAQVRNLISEGRALGISLPEFPPHLQHIEIAVVGEKNRGKSTFLNALLGAKVFPSRRTVCTAAITVLESADNPEIELVWMEETGRPPEQLPVKSGEDLSEAISRYASVNGTAYSKDLRETIVRYPNPYTVDGVRLVDTPGVNDPDHFREEVTYRYLQRASAVLFLLDPTQLYSSTDATFLRQHLRQSVGDKVIFVINKADQAAPGQMERLVGHLRKQVAEFTNAPLIHPVNSKLSLDERLAGLCNSESSGFPSLISSLETLFSHSRAGTILNGRLASIQEITAAVINSDKKLAATLAKGFNELVENHRDLIQHRDSLSRDLAALEANITVDLRKFESRLLQHASSTITSNKAVINLAIQQFSTSEIDIRSAIASRTETLFEKLQRDYHSAVTDYLTGESNSNRPAVESSQSIMQLLDLTLPPINHTFPEISDKDINNASQKYGCMTSGCIIYLCWIPIVSIFFWCPPLPIWICIKIYKYFTEKKKAEALQGRIHAYSNHIDAFLDAVRKNIKLSIQTSSRNTDIMAAMTLPIRSQIDDITATIQVSEALINDGAGKTKQQLAGINDKQAATKSFYKTILAYRAKFGEQ